MNNDIKGYRCPNCGSMIPISSGRVLKCECCGSEFEKEHKDIQRIYTTNIDGEDVLIGTRIYGYEMEYFKADPEGFLEYKLNDMAHKLAESILPHISIDVSEDLRTGGLAIRAKVRVGQPVRNLGFAHINYPEIQSDFYVED